MEQLSNLDQVDHLSTNRTLRDGDSAVDADYFDFEDLFFFFSASVEVAVHDQPDHRYQATGATSMSKGGEWGRMWGTLKIYVY